MARRNPQNARYRKDAQVGSTRRSASSAKPKREAGQAGASGGKGGSSAKSSARVPFEPDTPEFKRWRKIWLGLLVGAIVFSVGAWYTKETPVGTVLLVMAYTVLFGGLYVDFAKIRRMRKEWRAQMSGGGKPEKSEKPVDKKGDA